MMLLLAPLYLLQSYTQKIINSATKYRYIPITYCMPAINTHGLPKKQNTVKVFYRSPMMRQPEVLKGKGFLGLTNKNSSKYSCGLTLSARSLRALYCNGKSSLNGGYTPTFAVRPALAAAKYMPIENWRWYAEAKETGGSVRKSGGGLGKLDSANEDGFFFKLNKSQLKKMKQSLGDKKELKAKETPPDKKSE